MSYSIIVASATKTELQISYDWYEDQQIALGERFLLVIESCLSSRANQPLFYPAKLGVYREYVVPKFPM